MNAARLGGKLRDRDFIRPRALSRLRCRSGICPHLEIETYTFDVLPPEVHPGDLIQSIAHGKLERDLAAVDADVIWFPTVYTFVPVVTRRPIVTFDHESVVEEAQGAA
mgnify:CR=1 FL=1